MSEYKLTQKIVKNSVSNSWSEAVLEWELDYIDDSEEGEECACGHNPIKEICILKNTKNKNSLLVGNCCVKKFIKNIESNKIFASKRKVEENIQNSFNESTINFAFNKKWITQRDADFYLDIWRKRSLSEKQLSWKVSINKKILKNIKKQ